MENKVRKEHIVPRIPSFNRFHRTASSEHFTLSDIGSELQIEILNRNFLSWQAVKSNRWIWHEFCLVWRLGKGSQGGIWCLTSSWWRHHRQRIEHLQSKKSIPALLKTIHNWTLLKKKVIELIGFDTIAESTVRLHCKRRAWNLQELHQSPARCPSEPDWSWRNTRKTELLGNIQNFNKRETS